MRPMRRCKKPKLDGGSDEEDEKENKGVYSSFSSNNQPSEYRLTIYRYAIIVSFSKYH